MDEKSASYVTRSHASTRSGMSRGSAAAKARAKAEAAKARLAYVEKEMDLKLEKAKLEASMEMLHCQKETAAAIAEAQVLEAACGEEDERLSFSAKLESVPSLEPAERTKQYVANQAKVVEAGLKELDVTSERAEIGHSINIANTALNSDAKPFTPLSAKTEPPARHLTSQQPRTYIDTFLHKPNEVRFGNENATPVHPSPYYSKSVDRGGESQNVNDFVRYLARREIVATGLLQFNDKPENYRAWKRSFLTATEGLNLSPSEEMDLLLKWLGKDSAEHVERLRAIHINDPDAGLEMIWSRLEQTYGSAEVIEDALFKRLDTFPKMTNKDYPKLTKLSDLLMELQSAKDEGDLPGLSFLDTARGVNPIVQKLPFRLQEKWASVGAAYKRQKKVSYPPFSCFVDFIRQEASIGSDPSFNFISHSDTTTKAPKTFWVNKQREVAVHKTNVSLKGATDTGRPPTKNNDCDKLCPIHKKPHPLHKCRVFREKSIEDRKLFLKENNVCFKCCSSSSHMAKDCKTKVQCIECKSERHHTSMHDGPPPWIVRADAPLTDALPEDGGEQNTNEPQPQVTNECTDVCGENQSDRSCSKICLVEVHPSGQRHKAVKMYAILDEQSNRSLVRSRFFDLFGDQSPNAPYTLKTCAGVKELSGRRANGYKVESLDGSVSIPLPSLIECNDIPNNREEIPTRDAALHHPHLKSLAHQIPDIDPEAEIMLLLGRDIIRVHKVRKHVNGPNHLPYAQKLDLGWVIVGNVCLGNVHKPLTVSSFYTNTIVQTRPTLFQPCPNVFQVKEKYSDIHVIGGTQKESSCDPDHLGCTVFIRTKDDNQVAPSIQDAQFMKIMEQEMKKDSNNSWVAPLPFKCPRQRLPNNRPQALKRLMSLKRSFERNPEMKDHFLKFMDQMFKNGHAESAPPLSEQEERWYLPTFGVYHPRKPKKIRVVFDSSAQYEGVSLNQVLLSGPDLNNTLIGVLIRFRKEAVAFSADIEQMFYCFLVREEDRNFLRFLWFQDNDPSEGVVECRMCVHVFGNSPSPAVVIYGLHQSVQSNEINADPDVKDFVTRDFYVDDGLKSLATVEAAVDLLKRTQNTLSKSNLRLHKIAANNKRVMEAFPSEDHASDLKDLDLDADAVPLQRSLGLNWNLQTDCFLFSVSEDVKPFTRRGVLSTINSLYDPLGFVAPVTIQGKVILRELTVENSDWDEPLPKEMEEVWASWRTSLAELSNLSIPRQYTPMSPTTASRKQLCVFCDASTKAIGAVSYLKLTDATGNNYLGFVMGKAKLAPRPEHTVPRLELCAAVLAVELADLVSAELDFSLDAITFYSDSKVVLGYISNESRRFYVYVSNRVHRIRKSTHPSQWFYVPTDLNPADHATRSVPAGQLKHTSWLTGPKFLLSSEQKIAKDTYELVDPSSDPDVRPLVSTFSTTTSIKEFGSHRFERFSSWKYLTRAITRLIHICRCFRSTSPSNSLCKGWHFCKTGTTVGEKSQASVIIIQAVQKEVYRQEIKCIQDDKRVPEHSPLKHLDPFIDTHGLLRVGGRLHHSSLEQSEKNPFIIPGKHHVAVLLIREYHEQVHHQGRLFTEGAIRTAGFWIVGGKRKVSSVIHKCTICRRLRAPVSVQKMVSLPPDRLSMEPPFTNVGLDVFGPWSVSSRRTRGGLSQSKRWAVIFTCMSIRAVHIEIIESLDTSSFINALRRFMAVRGPVKHIRSDRGTNFVGACNKLKVPSNIDDATVKTYLTNQGCSWTFNPPHASHFGGTWERMIGLARRILDSMFLQLKDKLSHEVLTTFMAEVAAIINARPLVPVTPDPDNSFILTPAALLTQKVNYVPAPAGEFGDADLFKRQWRQVQHLSNTFWDRWRKQYLPTLQTRRKWQTTHPNIKIGTVVLLKDGTVQRNEWPLGVVTQTFPSNDGNVRQVQVKIAKPGGTALFLRPITEIVVLLPPNS